MHQRYSYPICFYPENRRTGYKNRRMNFYDVQGGEDNQWKTVISNQWPVSVEVMQYKAAEVVCSYS
jgi:hypothetical protein